MKKASKVLLILAGVFSLLTIFGVAIGAGILIFGAVSGKPFEPLYLLIEDYIKPIISEYAGGGVDSGTIEEALLMIYCVLVIVPSCAEILFEIIISILCFVGSGAKKKGVLIAIIVFSVLGGFIILPLVGAILGIVGLNQENRRANNSKAAIEETK